MDHGENICSFSLEHVGRHVPCDSFSFSIVVVVVVGPGFLFVFGFLLPWLVLFLSFALGIV